VVGITLKERTLAAMYHRLLDQVPAFLMAMDEWGDYVKRRGTADGRDLLEQWGGGINRPCIDLAAGGFAWWKGPERRDASGGSLSVWGTTPLQLCCSDKWPRPLAHIDAYYTLYYRKQVEICRGTLEILSFGDDFADNRHLLMPPALWRKWFKPLFAKYFAMGKAACLRTWLHACGAIGEVLPDLVDIGLDVWETVQAHLPGNEPERLKREFGRQLVFVVGIDTQHVLRFATPEEVRRHARERIRVLGKGGGCLSRPDHTIKKGVPFENVTALFDGIREFRGKGCTL
jgi:hypothetical protein